MGKHSKPKKPHIALWATALLPVGILAAAATADAAGSQPRATIAAADTHAAPTAPGAAAPAVPSPTPGKIVVTRADRVTPTPAPAPAPKPASVLDGAVPVSNFDAYENAARIMAATEPRCGIDWKLIAGIGRVESHHADEGNVDAHGTLRTPIFGPVLDGSLAGNQVVTDTDGGRLDGDATYDRAVGPMQFLPATWTHYAADGNGDGKIDPQNIFDAALTTARYLCADNLNLRNDASRVTAVLRYNNSMDYVDNVLGFARSY